MACFCPNVDIPPEAPKIGVSAMLSITEVIAGRFLCMDHFNRHPILGERVNRMARTQFVWILMLAMISTPVWADAIDSVDVEVTSQSEVSHLWRNRQFAIFLECWGGPDSIEVYKDPRSVDRSTASSGSMGDMFQGQGHAGFESWVPNRVDWQTSLTKDRDLTIAFSQKVSTGHSSTTENACSEQTFHSKLESLNNAIAVRAYFHVPDGVWLLRIKKTFGNVTANTYNPIKTGIDSVETVTADYNKQQDTDTFSKQAKELKLELDGYVYYFVHPDSVVGLTVDWGSDELASSQIKVQFEIRMMGEDYCAQTFGDPTGLADLDLRNVWGKLINSDMIETDPHTYIQRISCLRNKNYVMALLYANHGHDIVAALKNMNEAVKTMNVPDDWSFEDKSPELRTVIKVASRMTIFDLARYLLQDLHVYCDDKEITNLFGLDPAKKYKVTTYTYTARLLGRIRLLLEVVPYELIHLYANRLADLSSQGETYERFMKERSNFDWVKDWEKLRSKDYEVFAPVKYLIDSLPKTKSGEALRTEALLRADNGDRAAAQLDEAILTSFAQFSRRENTVIDSAAISSSLDQFEQERDKVKDAIKSDLEWFLTGGDFSVTDSLFLKDMQALNTDLMMPIAEILNREHGSKLGASGSTDFLRYQSTKDLYDEVNRCL